MLKKITSRSTSLIIDGQDIFISDLSARQIEIEIWNGTVNGPTGSARIGVDFINLKPYGDLSLQGDGKIVFSGLTFGNYYHLRARPIDNDKRLYGSWSTFYMEQAGDNTNDTVFGTPVVTKTSTACTFKVPVTIPADFERFEYYIQTAVKTLEETSVPGNPGAPSDDAVPSRTSSEVINGNAEFNFVESRLLFCHAWIRSVDQSGNRLGNGTAWLYLGCGYILPISDQTDSDNVPPDNTANLPPETAESLNYPASINWI